jgi:urease accessory protein
MITSHCHLTSGRRAACALRCSPEGKPHFISSAIQVQAAEEAVMDVTASSPQALTRAAYHLGNRHVPLQVGEGWLRLEQDHVLKEMLLGLDVNVMDLQAPFEPEAGAYGGGHRHHHDDETANLRQPARLKKYG